MGMKKLANGDWYYEPDTTTINTIDTEKAKAIMTDAGLDLKIVEPDPYIKEIERLNKIIDSTLKILEQQGKIIDLLMKEKDHG